MRRQQSDESNLADEAGRGGGGERGQEHGVAADSADVAAEAARRIFAEGEQVERTGEGQQQRRREEGQEHRQPGQLKRRHAEPVTVGPVGEEFARFAAARGDHERPGRREGVEAEAGQQQPGSRAAASQDDEQGRSGEGAREGGRGNAPGALPGGFGEEPEQERDAEKRSAEDTGEAGVRERIPEDSLLGGAADAEGEAGRERRQHARRAQEYERAAVAPAEALGADGKGEDDEAGQQDDARQECLRRRHQRPSSLSRSPNGLRFFGAGVGSVAGALLAGAARLFGAACG